MPSLDAQYDAKLADPNYVAPKPQTMLDKVNAAITTTQANIAATEQSANTMASVNPDALTKNPGETNTAFNTRVTNAYKAQEQPVLTDAEKAQGMYIQFVRTGANGQGEYRKLLPFGGTAGTGSTGGVGGTGVTGVTGGGGPDGVGTLLTKEQWDAIQAKTAADAATANEKRDAFALIQQTMQGYGFTTEEWNQLSKYIEDALINPKIGPNQMVLEMRALPVYKARFAGNETRVAAGLNALSEANYIQQENSYAEYFKAGGIANLGTRSMYAKLIGGAVAPTEVGKRINLAVDRVQNSDPQIMEQLTGYYTNITKSDLVGYFLDPTTVLPELEKKVTTAEIGTAAKEAGMDYGLERIAGLQAYGVDRAQAIAGYGNIGQVLPTSTKLGDIYSESGIKYDQTAGEAEFLKSDANAMEKRRQLKSLERSKFMGDSGVSAQVGSLNKNTQGAF